MHSALSPQPGREDRRGPHAAPFSFPKSAPDLRGRGACYLSNVSWFQALWLDPRAIAWLAALRSAGIFFASYLAWLFLFRQWVEPGLRRLVGSIAGGAVHWVPAGRGFRIWGLSTPARVATQAAVSLSCAAVVLSAALFPAALFVVGSRGGDPLIGASRYLVTIPTAAVFAYRMLSAVPEPS